jgi:hypothetical protein
MLALTSAAPLLALLFGVELQPLLLTMAGGVGAVIVAVISLMAGRRSTSGRVVTSEAATLWEAAEQIRSELRDEVLWMRAHIKDLEAAKQECLQRLHSASEKLKQLGETA